MAGLSTFITSLVAPIANKALVALGIGTVTYIGTSLALQQAINAAKNALIGMTPDVMSILAIAGLFDAMGIMAGALTSVLAFKSFKSFALKTS